MTNEELLEIISKTAQEKQTQLELRECDITSLPPEIGNLTNLTRIYLNGNKLESLPPEIGNLTNLTRLYLRDNQIQSLPPEIGNLTNLTHIYIRGNKLESLPPQIGNLTELKGLFLSDNNISSLPPQIKNLTKLGNLDLTRNPLAIPPDILNNVNEPSLIIQYYFKHNDAASVGAQPLNEVKMLLVGPSGGGKTSLLKRLVNNEFDPQVTATWGINRETWPVSIDEQNVKVNVWDFGGGEWMHSAHHFFFTKRSIYVIVVDNNKNEAENEVEYWLEWIKSYGGNCPVIIVGNKVDKKKLSFDRGLLAEKYPNIKTFVEISCEANYGIDELETIICQEIASLPHNIHQELDPTWLSVKKQLEQKSEATMNLAQYQRWARSEAIVEASEQSNLLKLLSDLGHVLCLGGGSSLEDKKIYKTEFIVDGIYKILNDPELKQYQGVLETEQLDRMFSSDLLRENRFLITAAMCKMDLAVEIDEQQMYLIVDLLGSEQVITGEWQDSLNFEYRYAVKPPSTIFSRFLIAMQKHIYENYYWRDGLILTTEENQALVKFARNRKKVSIWINGVKATREKFLKQICDRFYLIHKSIPGIEVEEVKGQAGSIIESDEDLNQEILVSETILTSEQDPTFILDEIDEIESDLPDRSEEDLTDSTTEPPPVENNTLIVNNILEKSSQDSDLASETEEMLNVSSSLPRDPQLQTENIPSFDLRVDRLENDRSIEENDEVSLGRFALDPVSDRDTEAEKKSPSLPKLPVVPPPPKLDFTPVEHEEQAEATSQRETAKKSGPNLALISIAVLAVLGVGVGTIFYIQSQSNDSQPEQMFQ